MATVHYDLCHFEEAEKGLLRSVTLQENSTGKDSIVYIVASLFYVIILKYYCIDVIFIIGVNTASNAIWYRVLGDLYYQTARFDKGKEHHEKYAIYLHFKFNNELTMIIGA
jgi:hypothetical protein